MDYAILEISDGDTTVNLLKGKQVGFHLRDWNPTIIQSKGGGVFQDSPIAPGRRLVYDVDGTAVEGFDLVVNNYDQNGIITESQDLLRLLLKARAYGSTDWQDAPVWIKARATCEDNARYAQIINFNIPQLDNPYAQPFFTANQIAAMDEITLSIERNHWLSEQPGTGAAVEASNGQAWDFDEGWVMYSTLGATPALNAPGTNYMVVTIGASTVVAIPTDSGGTEDIQYSTGKGQTWALSTGGGNITGFYALKIGSSTIIVATASGLIRSTDGGANFSALSSDVAAGPIVRLNNGNLLIANAASNLIYRSTDDGVNWTHIGTVASDGGTRSLAVSPTTGTVIARNHTPSSSILTRMYRSTDGGATWTFVYTLPQTNASVRAANLVVNSQGHFYLIDANHNLHKSTDDGLTWSIVSTVSTPLATPAPAILFIDSEDNVYAAGLESGPVVTVRKSVNGGIGFSLLFSDSWAGGTINTNMAKTDDGDIFFGVPVDSGSDGGLIYYINDAEPFGTSTDDKLYITNKQVMAQLTHIYVDDGGVFGSNLFPISAAFQMWPAAPAVNDAIYFGIRTALPNTGPFDNIRLYITSPAYSTTSYTAIWEYWTGAAWATLSVADNTNVGPGVFSAIGYNSVVWQPPSNWAATAVNSVTGYWVRCRVSAISGTLTPPTHGNADILTVNNAYIDIAEDGVLGDITALARIGLANESYYFSGSDNFFTRRIIAGLRSYSRGPRFQAYLNAADEQNPDGVSVSLGTNTTFGNDTQAPTGRRARYNPTASEGVDDRVTITLDSSIARDFYGTFHIFMRAKTTDAGLSARLEVATLSGGIVQRSATQALDASSFLLVDFGQMAFPIAGYLKNSELGDQFQIIIQAGATSGTPNLDIYDIILIPVDEWAIDAIDAVSSSSSQASFSFIDDDKFLDIDSLTPKTDIRTLVKYANSDEAVSSEWNPITNGPAIYQANARQRLWVLTATGGVEETVDEPYPNLNHSVYKLLKNQRYLGMRGDR